MHNTALNFKRTFYFSLQIMSREPLQSPEAASSPLLSAPAVPKAVPAATKTSRIPDIRGTTRLSPQKELPVRNSPITVPITERVAEGRYELPAGPEMPFLPRSKSSLDDGVWPETSIIWLYIHYRIALLRILVYCTGTVQCKYIVGNP